MEKMKAYEQRFLTPEITELRTDKKTGVISGYAIVFNSRSVLLYGQFYERIVPEAVDGVIEKSDCMALLDHNRSRGILGRSKFGEGTLKLTPDKKGVFAEFTPPDTALASEVGQYIERGEIDSMSFEFFLAEKGDRWEEIKGGKYERTILKFEEIRDVSLVFQPAYPETTAAIRSLNEFRGVEELKPAPKLSLTQLNEYYAEFEETLKQYKK